MRKTKLTLNENINIDAIKKIFKNFSMLAAMQVGILLLTLAIVPFLFRNLGADQYGVVVFANAVIFYFQILIDFGFQQSATKDLTLRLGKKNLVGNVFTTVYILKLLLSILSLIIVFLLCNLIVRFEQISDVILISLLLVVGKSLVPNFYYQAIEKMEFITIFNLAARSLFTICVFVFIDSKSSAYDVQLINGISFLLIGVISFVYTMMKGKINFSLPPANYMKVFFLRCLNVFYSNLSLNVTQTTNILVLGFFRSDAIVAFYGIGEKFVAAGTGVMRALTQALYPKIISHAKKTKGNKYFNYLLLFYFLMMLVGCVIFDIFSEAFIKLVTNEYLQQVDAIVGVIIYVVIFMSLNELLTQISISKGKIVTISKIMVGTLIINVVVLSFILYYFKGNQFVYYIVISQMLLFGILFYRGYAERN
ncbi:oligosaccharide flippase family protein [Ancylomarina longa]|uniref:Flippase n=1 Tax=Ancylomarina longa TaxID=2487017 RepID=A0A434AZW8_9BACT|nr:oligosaccharide flippase family protein [Ancylomarina longa]RUT80130.1 hypothetical protein DLK05_01875 [Ancylomarina longa]